MHALELKYSCRQLRILSGFRFSPRMRIPISLRSAEREEAKTMFFILFLSLLTRMSQAMDLTQILTMSAMSGGEEVDPLQIMLMTQLLEVVAKEIRLRNSPRPRQVKCLRHS